MQKRNSKSFAVFYFPILPIYSKLMIENVLITLQLYCSNSIIHAWYIPLQYYCLFYGEDKVWGLFNFIITACIVNVFILFHNCNIFGICKYLKNWFIILCTHCSSVLAFISLVISLGLLEDVLNFLYTRFFNIFCNFLPEFLNRWWFYFHSLFLQDVHCFF